MKVYLAAPWTHRLVAHETAKTIRAAGHVIVSRWHDEWALKTDEHVSEQEMATEAQMDLMDVQTAQIVIVLNIEKSEGKAVEQGIALASGIPIIIVGDRRTNVFQYLPGVVLMPTLADALWSVASPLTR